MHFTELGLETRLQKQLAHQGITEPTEIQRKAVPTAIAGHDVFAQSKTGSGKTLAFLLPAVHRIMKQKALSKRDPRVLIVAPTRELATQVFSQCRILTAGSNISLLKVLGGENFNDQIKGLKKDPQIVIGTPGRLTDHIKQHSLQLSGLELLIFDEADRMLDLGFRSQIDTINEEANHRLRQTLLFSATLDHALVDITSRNLLKTPKKIILSNAHQKHADISQSLYFADHVDHKDMLLQHFVKQASVKQCIIFTATRIDTIRISSLLNSINITAKGLAGDLSQSKRLDIMDEFSRGIFQVLVTTDVASRGLDLLSVSHVINFDLPKHAEEYIHRIGRTGRAGFKGCAISFVGPKDWASFVAIKNYINDNLEFQKVIGLEAKFNGFKANKPVMVNKDKKKVIELDKPRKRSQVKRKTPRKAIPAPFDIDGNSPLKKKSKPTEEK